MSDKPLATVSNEFLGRASFNLGMGHFALVGVKALLLREEQTECTRHEVMADGPYVWYWRAQLPPLSAPPHSEPRNCFHFSVLYSTSSFSFSCQY